MGLFVTVLPTKILLKFREMQTKLSTHYKEGTSMWQALRPWRPVFYSEWSPDSLFPDRNSRGCISASQGILAEEAMACEDWPSVSCFLGILTSVGYCQQRPTVTLSILYWSSKSIKSLHAEIKHNSTKPTNPSGIILLTSKYLNTNVDMCVDIYPTILKQVGEYQGPKDSKRRI